MRFPGLGKRGLRLPLLTMLLGGALFGAPPALAAPLPDLDQMEIKEDMIGIQAATPGAYSLGFVSEVANRGPGEFALHGERPTPDVDMRVQQLDGAPARAPFPPPNDTEHLDAGHPPALVPDVGTMRFVGGPGAHLHYHYLRFEIYQLRSAANPSIVINDQKQGFCLTAWSLYNGCGKRPDGQDGRFLKMDMGIPVGGTDKYEAFVEGQSLAITRTSAPTGRYILTHLTDPDNRLREANEANNAASAHIELTWPADPNGAPVLRYLGSCPDTATCGPESGNPAQPPSTGSGTQPTPTPAVDPPRPLSVADAKLLARRALSRRIGRLPRKVRGTCRRLAADRFRCGLRWTRRGRSYRAKVSVTYEWSGAGWQWAYSIDASARRRGCAGSTRGCVRRTRVSRRSGGAVPAEISARLAPRPRAFVARQAQADGPPVVPYICHVVGKLGNRR